MGGFEAFVERYQVIGNAEEMIYFIGWKISMEFILRIES